MLPNKFPQVKNKEKKFSLGITEMFLGNGFKLDENFKLCSARLALVFPCSFDINK